MDVDMLAADLDALLLDNEEEESITESVTGESACCRKGWKCQRLIEPRRRPAVVATHQGHGPRHTGGRECGQATLSGCLGQACHRRPREPQSRVE